MKRPHAFLTLDALRGLGAVVVLQAHLARFFGVPGIPHGPIAVDFFSMLSGFVLSFAYQPRLDRGWSFGGFFKTRLIRVYPVYLLGILGGFSFVLVRSHVTGIHLGTSSLGLLLLLSLMLLPAPSFVAANPPGLFPFDVPAWSLFAEIIVNILHAIFLRRRSWKVLLALAVVWGGVLEYGLATRGSLNFGSSRSELFLGFARVMFSYVLGALVFRAWNSKRFELKVSPLIPTALLVAVLMLPTSAAIASRFDLLLVVFVLPAIVFLGAGSQISGPIVPFAEILGASSYSVYMLHVPIAEFVEQIWKRVAGHRLELDAPWPGIVCLVGTLLISVAVDSLYDGPVRAFLSKRFPSGTRDRVPVPLMASTETATLSTSPAPNSVTAPMMLAQPE